ncbi:MAG: hypothetical protein J2P24_08725 [Streptosporangiales bacterium]|nr:hypothetical protein [Streptosporangiales bacterium]MBO0890377.1 hypothetical protein [Acidothermales bacterium]
MAKTSTPYAVDEVHSWARRSGERVHVVLQVPGLVVERGTEPTLELRRGKDTVTATAEVASTRDATALTANPLAADLTSGVWRFALRLPGEDGRRQVDARLLLPGQGPVALLTGPMPGRPLQPRPRGGSLGTRAVRTARKATDAALRELPPEQAVRCRRALRRVARAAGM